MRSDADIRQKLKFYNVGPGQVPGLIVMSLDDNVGARLDPRYKSIVAVINAGTLAANYVIPGYQGRSLVLHPVQAAGADPVVKGSSFLPSTGAASVPGRTAAVFVEERH